MRERWIGAAAVLCIAVQAPMLAADRGQAPAPRPAPAPAPQPAPAPVPQESASPPLAAPRKDEANPRVAPGLVKWHADFDAARAASARSGKPVLLFTMLGDLEREFC